MTPTVCRHTWSAPASRCACTTSAITEDSPLARIALDSNAVPMHAAFNATTGLENYGAALCGQMPPAMALGEHVFV